MATRRSTRQRTTRGMTDEEIMEAILASTVGENSDDDYASSEEEYDQATGREVDDIEEEEEVEDDPPINDDELVPQISYKGRDGTQWV